MDNVNPEMIYVKDNGDFANATTENFIHSTLNLLIQACHQRAKSLGWWPKLDGPMASENSVPGRNFGEMIALMHSELSEALEAYRDNDNMQEVRYEYKDDDGNISILYANRFVYEDDSVELGKPVGVASEFADVLIRVFDTCAALNIPLAQALIDKHAYNATRGHRHGGKLC